jgi:hypothetical protein
LLKITSVLALALLETTDQPAGIKFGAICTVTSDP